MHAGHLLAPPCISWNANSLLLPDDQVIAVRQWLARLPYQDNAGFLGWAQAWTYALGMVMFLVSETSRTVRNPTCTAPAALDIMR